MQHCRPAKQRRSCGCAIVLAAGPATVRTSAWWFPARVRPVLCQCCIDWPDFCGTAANILMAKRPLRRASTPSRNAPSERRSSRIARLTKRRTESPCPANKDRFRSSDRPGRLSALKERCFNTSDFSLSRRSGVAAIFSPSARRTS